jgi:hypothetical protein
MRKMSLIGLEIVMVVAIGFLTDLLAPTLISVDSRIVWGILIILLIILVPTTWLRLYYEGDSTNATPKASFPDEITLSISVASLRKNFKAIFSIVLNAVILGWLIAYICVLLSWNDIVRYIFGGIAESLTRTMGIGIFTVEVMGGCFIPLISYFVMKKRGTIVGLSFCLVSSLIFSIVQLNLIPGQYWIFTLAANVASFMLVAFILRFILPIVVYPIIEFWRTMIDTHEPASTGGSQ